MVKRIFVFIFLTFYLNAIQTTEKIYIKSHTRFFLGLIPLLGGGGEEAERLKEGIRTIEDKKFYQGFFEEIEGEIKRLKRIGKAGGESE